VPPDFKSSKYYGFIEKSTIDEHFHKTLMSSKNSKPEEESTNQGFYKNKN